MLLKKPRIGTEIDLNGKVLAQVMDEYQRATVDPAFANQPPNLSAYRMVVKIAAKWLRLANHLSGEKREG